MALHAEEKERVEEEKSPQELIREKINKHRIIRSPSRRFTIVSKDAGVCMDLSSWSENVTKAVERMLGIEIPSDNKRFFRVAGFTGGESNSVHAVTAEEFSSSRFALSITIPDVDKVSSEIAEEAFCLLLLSAYLQDYPGEDDVPGKKIIPYWLSKGVQQNLHPSIKAKNSELVLGAWRQGGLPTLVDFLGSDAGKPVEVNKIWSLLSDEDAKGTNSVPGKSGLQKAVCGVFVGWLLSQPSSRDLFENIFTKLAAGDHISADWFIGNIPNCTTIAGFEGEWDKWMLQQKRMVYKLGVITQEAIEQFKAQLLLYPGDFAIPLSCKFKSIRFHDLVEKRNESWVPLFARNKVVSLQLSAIGRGDEFKKVISLYCQFLEALNGKKSDKALVELLKKAENELKLLEEKVVKEKDLENKE